MSILWSLLQEFIPSSPVKYRFIWPGELDDKLWHSRTQSCTNSYPSSVVFQPLTFISVVTHESVP